MRCRSSLAVASTAASGCTRWPARRRVGGPSRPDLRPGETNHGVRAELAGHAGRSLHILRGTLAHTFRIAVAPGRRSHDRLVPEVDRVVTYGLPSEVVRDCEQLEMMALEDLGPRAQIRVVLVSTLEIEMIPGCRDFQAVIAPAGGEPRHLFKRQVSPLASEQGDGVFRSAHRCSLEE